MNRTQAIEAAKNLRKGMFVYVLESERVPFRPAVEAKEEIKAEDGTIIQAAVEAVPEQAAVGRKYLGYTFASISLAKKFMRTQGIGVALLPNEHLPQ